MSDKKDDAFLKLMKLYIPDEKYKYFKYNYDKNKIHEEDLVEIFTWRYDEIFQKSNITEQFFSEMNDENLPFVTVFGTEYSGREYFIQRLFNATQKSKTFYFKELENDLGMKILTNNNKKFAVFRAYPLDPIYFENDEYLKKTRNKKFINNFLAKHSNIIIYIDNNESNDDKNDFSTFINNFSLNPSSQKIIYIKNIFSKRDESGRNKNEIGKQNNCSTYKIYYNEITHNSDFFEKILNEMSHYLKKKSITSNFKALFKQYFDKYYQTYIENDYILKCDYAEYLNQNINFNLIQTNHQLIFIIENVNITQKTQITSNNIIIDNIIYIKINLKSNDVNDVLYQKINVQTSKKKLPNPDILNIEQGEIKVIFSF